MLYFQKNKLFVLTALLYNTEFVFAIEQAQQSLSMTNAHDSNHLMPDLSTVPQSFLSDIQREGFPVTVVYEGNDFGDYQVQILPGKKVRFINAADLLKKLPFKREFQRYVKTLLNEGFPINEDMVCDSELISKGYCHVPDKLLLRGELDFNALRFSLEIDPDLFVTTKSGKSLYLENINDNYLSSIFSYTLNSAQTFGSSANNNNSSLTLNNITGFGKTSLSSAVYMGGLTDKEEFSYNLSRALLTHTFAKSAMGFGYTSGSGIVSSANAGTNYSYGGNVIAASWYSSNNLLLNRTQKALTPIIIFVPRQSTVRVYKDNQMLSLQNFDLGSHELDTSSFPGGVYPVRVEVYEGSTLISSETHIINKPFDLSALDPETGIAYAFWAGAATAKTDASDHYNFNRPYFGASLRSVLNRYTFSSVSAYGIGDLYVGEFNNQLQLPFEISGNLNAGLDSFGGFAVNANINKYFQQGISFGLTYSQNESNNDNSPFNGRSQTINANASLSLSSFGSLSGSTGYSFLTYSQNYNISYSIALYKKHGLYISANASSSWDNEVTKLKDVNYMFGLSLSYTFDDGATLSTNTQYEPQQKMISSSASYSPNSDREHLISSMSIGYSHNLNSDMVNTSLGFDQYYVKGSINATATQNKQSANTQTLSGSLSGSLILTPDSASLSGNLGNDAGVILDLDIPKGETMRLIANGSSYPVYRGVNFIPLMPYKQYDIYLQQRNLGDSSLVWDEQQNHFTLYPGNVFTMTSQATQVVQIMGQIVDSQGQPVAFAKVDNGLALSYSDASGYFMTGLSAKDRSLTITAEHASCLYTMEEDKFASLYNGYWIGSITCNDGEQETANIKQLEQF